ncbi:MAG: tRNA ((37)-N6)-dimethylallyltransferase MiaA [Bacteroidota bacterium]|jgi:tRNA dimethylallyltransferase
MNYLIVIGGPTAAGKTSLALTLARKYNSEIISADSRQFYREMNIGTAKPSKEELESIPHHFINTLGVEDSYDISQFEHGVLKLLKDKFRQHNIMIMVGGSGLYHEAVIHGLDELPPRDEVIRRTLEQELNEKGLQPLQLELKDRDPQTSARIDLNNPLRVLRALEICRTSGQPYSSFIGKKKNTRDFKPLLMAVSPERSTLYDRINKRVDEMIQTGLVEEVQSLLPYRSANALRTVGYSELFDYFDGKTTLEEAIDKIKQHTRNYAKRQLTWFRNQSDYTLFDPQETEKIIDWIESNSIEK